MDNVNSKLKQELICQKMRSGGIKIATRKHQSAGKEKNVTHSGGVTVFAARSKRLCCRLPPPPIRSVLQSVYFSGFRTWGVLARNVPHCFAAILRDWYSKLASVVRWNGVLSSSFAVTYGVREGGILSPILFNVYVDELIELLRDSGYGCYVNRTFIGCLMCADDLLLLSPTVGGMQALLDICDSYGHSSNIIFNNKKTTCSVLGNARHNDVSLSLNDQRVPIVDSFKYLGVKFVAKIFYMFMFRPLNESFMQHVTVYLI